MSTEDKKEWHEENCVTCGSRVLEKVDEDGTPEYRPIYGPLTPHRDDRKTMAIKEFRERGLLQELNRQFLHPLGLALEVWLLPNGEEMFGQVWDSRDDPEGIVFGPDTMEVAKAKLILEEQIRRSAHRENALGYNIQPLVK